MQDAVTPAPTRQPSQTLRQRTFRVKAVWKTLQGEGFFAGRPAVFVRLVGCNMWSGYEHDRASGSAPCAAWCDTDFTKEGSTAYTASDLAQAMQQVGGAIDFCVLTGGEPLLQANATLIRALHDAGYLVAVETNGTLSLRFTFLDPDDGSFHPPDWIVCSPKLPEQHLRIEYCDELKLVVPDYMPHQYPNLAQRVRTHDLAGRSTPLLWLQPEDGPRLDAARQLALNTALANPAWRVSTQTHKLLGIE